ncbi:hypothetical protein [Capnocytophaga canimorsus]|uniref:Lipoprotein n=1 Tax=Capnocytophaga canimorsus TaxID=28188 RepID=A0A0B7HIS7_9FLAO|nr:hypothetical protein [Capnocytophaga canimorsus]ATA76268.1 hypothetical protein CGC47_00965 [Capnocytophaga canimorsus]ATA93021.1 hypothetical protein CGC54_00955 [Capnocytophaga canimorsus]AWL77688.1 hypothetical protein DKB58_01255 [Capnocytophaga canimorsus]AYW36231.1 hypothetical protein D8L92_02095 [Capnocytophaga canimorsus]MDT9500302.1 hypothetical protein [Capnocytophaga canimorsus]
MKRIVNKIVVAVGLITTLVSCSKDNNEVVTPDLNHQEPEFHKVDFIFTEGHTHGLSFHGDPKYEGVKYLVNQQKVTFEFKDKKWEASGADVIRWRQSSYYGLEIVYYNEKGERINSEYIEHANSHQHFFQFQDVKTIKTGELPADNNTIASYLYRDTNPENKYYTKGSDARLLDNPVGLKGYFHVKQNYLTFNLKVTLAHFLSGNKKQGEKYLAYNELPSPNIAAREFEVQIPIRIYNDRLEKESVTLQDMADEFKITIQEAEKELETIIEADIDPESSQVWM